MAGKSRSPFSPVCRRLEGGCPSQCLRTESDWERRHLGGAWNRRGLVAKKRAANVSAAPRGGMPLIPSKNYAIILSKDLEKLYAHYQASF